MRSPELPVWTVLFCNCRRCQIFADHRRVETWQANTEKNKNFQRPRLDRTEPRPENAEKDRLVVSKCLSKIRNPWSWVRFSSNVCWITHCTGETREPCFRPHKSGLVRFLAVEKLITELSTKFGWEKLNHSDYEYFQLVLQVCSRRLLSQLFQKLVCHI